MKLEPLPCRSESPVQGMSDRQQESRGFNPVRKSNTCRLAPTLPESYLPATYRMDIRLKSRISNG